MKARVLSFTPVELPLIFKQLYLKACIKAAHFTFLSQSTPTTHTTLRRSSARRRCAWTRDFRTFDPFTKLSWKIYHPNVDLEGNVCLNILREDWKPVLNLNSVMVGLQYLFLEPNADDPLNKGAALILLADLHTDC
jgi:hypothetical protein